MSVFALSSALALSSAFALSEPTNPSIYTLRKQWNWCGERHEEDPLVGLDDKLCQKVFPRNFDRDFMCSSDWDASPGFFPAATSVARTDVNEEELAALVPKDSSIAIGIIRRHAGRPFTIRYIGHNAKQPFEPWSSTKIFAADDAARRLRSLSVGRVGLPTTENGPTHRGLDDLMTIVASYDTTMNLTSNSLGAYYHAIGGHVAANSTIHNLIGAPTSESFGGNYGEPPPAALCGAYMHY